MVEYICINYIIVCAEGLIYQNTHIFFSIGGITNVYYFKIPRSMISRVIWERYGANA